MKEVIHSQQLCIYWEKLPKTELILGIHWILTEYLIISNETQTAVAVWSVIPASMYILGSSALQEETGVWASLQWYLAGKKLCI